MTRWLPAVVAALLASVVVVGLVLGPGTTPDRVEQLGQGIRCPVCQAESIADSPSTTAQEMMDVVREQVAAGRSDDEVRAYFAERYGRWVLLDPGVTAQTLALWSLPALGLAAGVAIVRRQLAGDGPPPPDEELAQLQERVARLRADKDTADAG